MTHKDSGDLNFENSRKILNIISKTLTGQGLKRNQLEVVLDSLTLYKKSFSFTDLDWTGPLHERYDDKEKRIILRVKQGELLAEIPRVQIYRVESWKDDQNPDWPVIDLYGCALENRLYDGASIHLRKDA